MAKRTTTSKKPTKSKKRSYKKKEKHPGGRPDLFKDEKLKAEIIRYIENGNNYRDSCVLANVSETTFHKWAKQGRDDIEAGKKTEYTEFTDKIAQAKTKYKAWLIQSVNNTCKKDGKLALEVLSRKYEEFAKRDSHQVNHTIEGEAVDIIKSILSKKDKKIKEE